MKVLSIDEVARMVEMNHDSVRAENVRLLSELEAKDDLILHLKDKQLRLSLQLESTLFEAEDMRSRLWFVLYT